MTLVQPRALHVLRSSGLNDYENFGQIRKIVQNSLDTSCLELIYRTENLGKYNQEGELVFVSRKDDQMKLCFLLKDGAVISVEYRTMVLG